MCPGKGEMMEAEKTIKIDESDTPGRYYHVQITWNLSVDGLDAKTRKEALANLDKIKAEIQSSVRSTMETVSSAIEGRFIQHFDEVYITNQST
jgi:hypothetical protein